jgi:uncharacterized protein (TIGR03118 family)
MRPASDQPITPMMESLEPRALFAFAGNVFTQTNLVSDGFVSANHTDTDLKNPWGMARSAANLWWISNNGSSNTTLYDDAGNKQSLTVSIPGGGGQPSAPTGQVFNATNAFMIKKGSASAPATFIFVGEDGGISAWNASVDDTHALLVVDHSSADASYKGVTIGSFKHQPRLFAANFASGRVEVYDGAFSVASKKRMFRDPSLPAGYAPFNVENLNGLIYVTYALRGPDGDDVGGKGHGFVDVYSTNGVLLKQFVHGKYLNSPWGLAVAPASFGPIAGDILVGQFGNGTIDVFQPKTGKFLGTLNNAQGVPVTNPGLWALATIKDDIYSDGALYFTAGLNDEADGLFGRIDKA